MNVMNNSSDEQVECPLCMEPLEVDDLNFYPCTCGYQICRFCWHRIRTDENELCPACRKAYPENPADFTPLSQEQIAAFKAEKRQRDQQRKAKISENRKHLANVRVVQKNLVFVVGLPPRLAEAEILKKHEYFGKYGKIHKVVINPSTTYAGVQGPSASAYVTYVNNNDALRAIQSVNNIMIDNRLIKTSLGTTKYCSHFMKNQTCPKPDCMYLHELGDSEASFTKEEMHQGKHQEYEKRLHDTMLAAQASQPVVQTNGISTGQTIGTTTLVTMTNGIITNGTGGGKTGDTKQISDITNGPIQNKDAWPSLSTSPVNTKENKLNGKTGTNNKENINRNDRKHDKTKMDKSKGGTKVSNGSQKTTNGTHNTNTESHKSKHIKQIHHHITDVDDDDDDDEEEEEEDDDEIDEFEELDNDALSSDNEIKADTPSLSSNNGDSGTVSGKSSPGAFPDPPQISSPSTHEIHTGSQNGHVIANSSMAAVTNNTNNSTNIGNNSNKTEMSINNLEKLTNSVTNLNSGICSSGSSGIGTSESTQSSSSSLFSNAPASQSETTKLPGNLNGVKINANNLTDASSRFSKLSLFDDNNSFFSHNAFQSFYGGLNGTLEHGHTTNSHLPDLLNGTTDSQEHSAKELLKNLGLGISDTNSMPLNTTDDWEAAFKYMMRNNKTVDDHEEYMRMQELQKRNNFINSGLNLPQFNNGFNGDVNLDYFHNSNDLSSRLSHQSQNQQQRLNSLHSNGMGHVYPENMSKFFDFHKNQQQQQQQSQQNQFILNGHSSNIVPPSPADPMNIASLLENSRFNTNFIDQQHTNGLLGSQMQKQRLLNNQMNTHNLLLNNNQQQQPQQNNRLLNSQFTQNQNIDDDLGFDPFFETQKGLAELLNDEILQHQQQQQQTSKILENVQRTRMPPPGFNHMNAFGFGVPRAQVNDISGSKILPFMNLGNNTQPQQQQPPQTNWGQQQQQQQQHMGYPQNEQSHAQQQNNLNKSGFGNNFNTFTDWTSFDPAIVSFRQFPSFINGQSVNGPNQPNGNDIFMSQQLNQQNLPQQQQQQQQPGQGFGHHGINLQSSIMNQQQSNQQAQVNFSHSNWLNTDQNIYMNNLSNGFTNNFEKFTIPMPPGFQSNVTGTSKQKAECIN